MPANMEKRVQESLKALNALARRLDLHADRLRLIKAAMMTLNTDISLRQSHLQETYGLAIDNLFLANQ